MMTKGKVYLMKANVKRHIVICILSAVCIVMVCLIGTQFRTDVPAADNVAEESTEAKITVNIEASEYEEKESDVTDSNTVNDKTKEETREIQYDDFTANGGVEINQNFEEADKPEPPAPPEIEDKEALKDPTKSPQYGLEQTEIKPQTTEQASDTPKHGDKKDGMIYINGFGWVVDQGGGGVGEPASDMYENGNKIGYFG